MGGYAARDLTWGDGPPMAITGEQLWVFLAATESEATVARLRALNEVLVRDLYAEACARWYFNKLFDRFLNQETTWQAPAFIGGR